MAKIRNVVVYHSSYGCSTGCCGHIILVDDEKNDGKKDRFTFDHPADKEDAETFAREWAREWVEDHLVDEHYDDLDWSKIIINWDRVSAD